MIEIYVRDINGKRMIWKFNNTDDFMKFYHESADALDEGYEIQVVVYDGHCIYSGLANDHINFADLCGFFA